MVMGSNVVSRCNGRRANMTCCACSRRPARRRSASRIRRSGPRSRAWIALRRRSASDWCSASRCRYSRPPHCSADGAVMRVLVIGSGVIGTAVGYSLTPAGHEVEVVNRQPGPPLETSYAKAGAVSPGCSAPGAGRARQGDPADADAAQPARHLAAAGCGHVALGPHDAGPLHRQGLRAEQEPQGADRRIQPRLPEGAARSARHRLRRARTVHAAAVPDAEATRRHRRRRRGAEAGRAGGRAGRALRWKATVRALQAAGGAIEGVATDAGLLTADRIVLALGSGSPLLLLQPLGIRIPVYPAKGCSITVPTTSPTPPVRPRARSWTRRTRWR